jgi:hypothetical protein
LQEDIACDNMHPEIQHIELCTFEDEKYSCYSFKNKNIHRKILRSVNQGRYFYKVSKKIIPIVLLTRVADSLRCDYEMITYIVITTASI